MESSKTYIIGYSGHSYVVIDIILRNGESVHGYFDKKKNKSNPYNLKYLGNEMDAEKHIFMKSKYFISVGDNSIRKNIYKNMIKLFGHKPINIIDKSSSIGSFVKLGEGIMVGSKVVINSSSQIGNGVICNTSCIIEHEAQIGDFTFIAPNSTILGNVKIGKNCFIGSNSVIKQGVKIGNNVMVGAGSVILKDVPSNKTIFGNPGKIIQ